jgi:hypothetical protein
MRRTTKTHSTATAHARAAAHMRRTAAEVSAAAHRVRRSTAAAHRVRRSTAAADMTSASSRLRVRRTSQNCSQSNDAEDLDV